MQIGCEKRDDVLVVVLRGEVDAENVTDLLAFFERGECREEKRIVLDLTGLRYVDSSGLGAFVKLMKAARRSGGDVRLAGPTREVLKVLELTRLNRVFDVCPDREEALAHFCGV